MKKFNLEEVKAGKPVCTKNKEKVRILCFDFKNKDYPIVAAICTKNGGEEIASYTKEGCFLHNSYPGGRDLMMAPEKHEGWINLYRYHNSIETGILIYKTEEEAKSNKSVIKEIVDTIKIEWED